MDYKFKTTNIKGKEYVEVNQRLLFFRKESKYEGWSIHNEIVAVDSESCIIKCSILDQTNRLIATAHAQEDRTASHINKTSYIENCETSALGRALAMLGIGIETSIASSNEVNMAIAKQEQQQKTDAAGTESVFTKAVMYISGAQDKEERANRFEITIKHYGKQLNKKEQDELRKLLDK
jgi:hypothetical protein